MYISNYNPHENRDGVFGGLGVCVGDWVGVSDGGGDLRKMPKKCQKSYQKEHPALQKPEVLHEKLKILKFYILFTQKEHPAPQKAEIYTQKT